MRSLFIFCFFILFFSVRIVAQSNLTESKTIYLTKDYNVVPDKANASYYVIIKLISGKIINPSTDYYMSGAIHWTGNVVSYEQYYTTEGLCTWYDDNGKKQCQVNISSNHYNGKFNSWYPNGKLKEEADYVNDLIDGCDKTFDESGNCISAIIVVNGKTDITIPEEPKYKVDCNCPVKIVNNTIKISNDSKNDPLEKHRSEIGKIKEDLLSHSNQSPYGGFTSIYNEKYSGGIDANNSRNGNGILVRNNGSKYEGYFMNGNLQKGYVDEITYNGEYIGQFNNFNREGTGTYALTNGSKYEGMFSGGNLLKGYVTEIDYNGTYTGEYNNFIREGNGVLVLKNGSKYEGYFSGGNLQRGTVVEINSNGKYTGEFNNFQREGNGLLILNNGSTYEGYFMGGNFQRGDATEINYNGKYVGKFDYFQRDGEGILILTNGNRYEGTFKGGNFMKGNANEVDYSGNRFICQYDNFQRLNNR